MLWISYFTPVSSNPGTTQAVLTWASRGPMPAPKRGDAWSSQLLALNVRHRPASP